MDKIRIRITDIPAQELGKKMAEYGRKNSTSVSKSRKYLRSIGMNIGRDGRILN